MNNEILDDCKQFADRHRGKNKQSGPHWSTIIRFAPLYDEAVRLQNQVRTLLKSKEIDNETNAIMEIEQLKEAIDISHAVYDRLLADYQALKKESEGE